MDQFTPSLIRNIIWQVTKIKEQKVEELKPNMKELGPNRKAQRSKSKDHGVKDKREKVKEPKPKMKELGSNRKAQRSKSKDQGDKEKRTNLFSFFIIFFLFILSSLKNN